MRRVREGNDIGKTPGSVASTCGATAVRAVVWSLLTSSLRYAARASTKTTWEAAYRFAKAGFGKPSVLVAFALQMGVVYYTLHQEYDLPISALYQGCNGFGVTDYSQACQADTTELTFERTVIGLIPPEVVQMFGGRRLFLSHDTLDLMEMKASRIMSRSDIRDKFTWFLFNVHLTDHTKSCLPGGPFERLKGFRQYLDRRAGMPKG